MNIITLLLPFLCAAHASSNVHADNRFDFILQLYAPEDIREKIVGRAKVETGGEVGELTWEGNRQSGKDQGTCFDKEGKMQVGMADCEYGLKSFPMFKLRFTDSNDYTLEEPRPLDITIDGEVIMRVSRYLLSIIAS
jgi:hypothetical protein